MANSAENLTETVPFALAEELLRQNGEMRFVAQGGSMLPAILPGDELIVYRAVIQDICVGDTVLFKQHSRWFAHRVRRIQRNGLQTSLITRGDALGSDDTAVFPDQLLGRVMFRIRDGEQRVLASPRDVSQVLLRVAVQHVPHFAGLYLGWRQHRDRIASFLGRLPRRSTGTLTVTVS